MGDPMKQHGCLDDEILAAYFDGLLSANQEDQVYANAMDCGECQSRLTALALMVRDTDSIPADFKVPHSVTQRAIELLPASQPMAVALKLAVRWLEGSIAPLLDAIQPLQSPMTATRGVAAQRADYFDDLRFHVTLGELPLEIDLEVDGPEEVALTVRPMAIPPTGILLRLSRDGETRAVSSLNAAGTTVSSLEPGSYALKLEHATQIVGQLSIELHR
jgi:hypothetical protein